MTSHTIHTPSEPIVNPKVTALAVSAGYTLSETESIAPPRYLLDDHGAKS
jgi:hypothetical protein